MNKEKHVGHITIPHSQSHRNPDHWNVSALYVVVQVSVCEKNIKVVTEGNTYYHYFRETKS